MYNRKDRVPHGTGPGEQFLPAPIPFLNDRQEIKCGNDIDLLLIHMK